MGHHRQDSEAPAPQRYTDHLSTTQFGSKESLFQYNTVHIHKAMNTSIQCKTVLCLHVLYVCISLLLLLNCAPLSTPKSNVIIINILKQNVCYYYNPPSPLLVNLKIKTVANIIRDTSLLLFCCVLVFYLLATLVVQLLGWQCQSNTPLLDGL